MEPHSRRVYAQHSVVRGEGGARKSRCRGSAGADRLDWHPARAAAAVRAGVRQWRSQRGDSRRLQRGAQQLRMSIGAAARFWLFERILALSA